MSKRYFISTSRIVLSIAATGIVGLAATPQAEAAEVTAVVETPATNAASTEATSSEVVAEEVPTNEETVASETAVEESVASGTAESSAITETTEEVAAEPVVEESTIVDPVLEDVITEDLTVSEVAVEAPVTTPTSDVDTDGDGRVDEITIAHTNDIHGRAEQANGVIGIANAAQYFEEVGADVIVDAGDAFQGLPLSNHDEGAAMAEAMNEAGYDAMAVGNHEFDFGQDVATGYQDKTGFPVLSVNTVYADSQELVFEPSTNVATQGYNLGVIGVTTPETATKTHPNNVQNIEFLSPIDTTVNEISRLIEDQTTIEDAFILLSHLGVDATTNEEWRATALAAALDDVAAFDAYQIIILDGHSHTAFANERYGNVLLQQTGTALNNIGLVTLNFVDPSLSEGQLVDAQTALETIGYEFDEEGNQVTAGRTNETVQAIVDEASAAFEEETGRVIVEENPIWFNGVREYVRSHETNSGTYVTDAMVEYGRNGGFNNPTDFAMINGGGIRDQIVQGEPITEGDVIAVLPFGNIISQIQVTGETIYDMFELAYSATTVTESYSSSDGQYTVEAIDEDSNLPSLAALGGFLQVSSDIKIYFDPTLEAGQRILGVYILNRETGEFELVADDASDSYFMATNDFLAQGGDGYTMLSGEREEGPSLDRVVMDAMETGVVNLADYADELPQNQIIPMLTADYDALLAEAGETPGEEVPGEEVPGEEAPSEETPSEETPSAETPAEEGTEKETTSGKTDGQSGSTEAGSTGKTTEKADNANKADPKTPGKSSKAEEKEAALAAAATLPKAGFTAGDFGYAFSAIVAGLGLALPGRKRK
ncbi:5'-nucleotidase C-terminal domain-containing protein [Aerococcus viridans]|uniref:Bifunctional metallophosphatase/5'-nucleotidase n=1 Tax=Aerococcus viridans TaxID=1377 RepID=A0A2J9PMU8_9LACT|nr:5'-nucleotidase C-terminal domain-containing protein [Aerococcus viridans]MCT1797694.1 5'-nucleotidase C-terminal domain-containing protein [Aerococcus viridans]PNL91674.1 bifunctional metallophosphatase/5'-nucleotidase [Aerococcus viridans]